MLYGVGSPDQLTSAMKAACSEMDVCVYTHTRIHTGISHETVMFILASVRAASRSTFVVICSMVGYKAVPVVKNTGYASTELRNYLLSCEFL